MHETSPILTAEKREKIGTRYCDRLRKQGKLPAIVYGKGHAPIAVSVDFRQAWTHLHKGEKIFRIDLPGTFAKQITLLKDLQFDHLGTRVVHADFESVALTDRIKTKVPIRLSGEAVGLKQAGAILMHPVTEIVVECVVNELPEFIEVSIAELDVGHAITAGDVKLPSPGMKLLTDRHGMVAQIVIQQEIVVGEATATDAAAAEPEVLTAKKPAEGEEGAAAKPAAGGKEAAKPAAKDAAKPAGGGKDKK